MGLPWGQSKRLSETDAVLLFAYSIYKAERCSCCGQRASEAHDDATDGFWEVRTVTCYAGVALGEDKAEREPGELRYLLLNRDAMQTQAEMTGHDKKRR